MYTDFIQEHFLQQHNECKQKTKTRSCTWGAVFKKLRGPGPVLTIHDISLQVDGQLKKSRGTGPVLLMHDCYLHVFGKSSQNCADRVLCLESTIDLCMWPPVFKKFRVPGPVLTMHDRNK